MFKLGHWFRKFSEHRRYPAGRSRLPIRLAIEALENRLVPSVNPSGDLAHIPYVSPSGPTMLGLNFDGEHFYSSGGFLGIGSNNIYMGAYSPGSPTQTDANIQDILFRVAEIYAPFNVQVTRVLGAGTYFNNHGNTTVFVGPSADSGPGTTPDEFTDFPTSTIFPGLRNSHTYDLAFVDPNQNDGGLIPDVAQAIAHEAGHTFGLAHVRTDGLSDPAPLGPGTIPEVMSYNRFNGFEYFKDQSLLLTAWNNTSSGLQLSASMPAFPGLRTTTQDSFYSLGQVLGYRSDPVDTQFHVADSGAIDPNYGGQYVASSDSMNPADSIINEQGTITRLGDYDVYRWTAPATETINVNLAGQNGLDPVLLVYDNAQLDKNGSMQLATYQHAFGPIQGSLNVQAGTSYYFVIGAHDSVSTGTYSLTINQLPNWAQLSGSTLSINGNQLGAASETLSIDSNAQGKLVVSLNNLPQKVQFGQGQITAININSLGTFNNITVSGSTQNLNFLPPQITINLPGTFTNLYVKDGLSAPATTYTLTANGLTRAAGFFDDVINYVGLSSVSLQGGTGRDVFVVQSTPQGASVNLQTGAGTNEVDLAGTTSLVTISDFGTDTIIAATGQNLDGIAAVTVNGNGKTSLTVNDQQNPTSAGLLKPSTQYAVTGNSLTRTVFYPSLVRGGNTTTRIINYQNLAGLTLNAGNYGANTIDIEGTPAPTTINGGAATSEVDIAPTAQTLDNINGPLTIAAKSANVKAYDQLDTAATSGTPVAYTLASSYVARDALVKGSMVHTQIFPFPAQSITLYTSHTSGSHPNTVTAGSAMLAPAPLTLNSGSADKITVGALDGQLTADAHGGTVTFDDVGLQNSYSPYTSDPQHTQGYTATNFTVGYTVTDHTVERSEQVHQVEVIYPGPYSKGGQRVSNYSFDATTSYQNVKRLTIVGGPVDGSFNVQSTPTGIPVAITGSTGSRVAVPGTLGGPTVNRFILGLNGSVKNIRSALTLNASSANDTLVIDDSQATAQDKVTVTPTQVGAAAADQFFASGASLTYGGFSALTLNLSHAADDSVQLTPSAATAFSINGDLTEFLAGHGAALNVDLTGVLDALLTPGTISFTKGSRQQVTFKNMGTVHTH
jgi:hypothetical protein